MVARVTFGKDMDGAVRYNEAKVKEGVATCLDAAGFGCDPGSLTTVEKVRRLNRLAVRNQGSDYNVVHISLNFPPEEHHDTDTLQMIAHRYMEKIGFGDQPYLLYEHRDAGHPHIHIVTTNIRANGSRIETHLLGKKVSEPARKSIEHEFGLIRAEDRKKSGSFELPALDVEALQYGKKETKSAISNVVRQVVSRYKFASLEEFNVILRDYNIVADPGAEGSRRSQKKGLAYHMVNAYGAKVGRQINASTIYESPTIDYLEGRYEKKKEEKRFFRGRVSRIVSDVLKQSGHLEDFKARLAKYGITAHFHYTGGNFAYGVQFVDHSAKVVFNGSALGKDLSAPAIMKRLASNGDPYQVYNTLFVEQLLARTNFKQRPGIVLRQWRNAGLRFGQVSDGKGGLRYVVGFTLAAQPTFIAMPAKMRAWLMSAAVAGRHKQTIRHPKLHGGIAAVLEAYGRRLLEYGWDELAQATADILDYTYSRNATPHQFLQKKKRKKKRRR